MHRLLQRQLRRIYPDGIPDDSQLTQLIELVDEGYQHFDEQLTITERSLDISCSELTHRNHTLNLILDSLPDMSLWIDSHGNVKDIRSGNFDPPLLTSESNFSNIFELEIVRSSPELKKFINGYQTSGNKSADINIHCSGTEYIMRVRLTNMTQNTWLLVFRDIYLRKKLEELQQQRFEHSKRVTKQLQGLVNAAPIGIIICNPQLEVTMVNEFSCRLLNRPKSEVVDRHPSEFIASHSHKLFRSRLCLVASQTEGVPTASCDLMLLLPDGRFRQVEFAFSKLSFDEQPLIIMSITDIEERKSLENKLRTLAATDALTGAFNRRSFQEQTERALSTCARWRAPLTVVLLDIDHFKQVNDQFGHAAGDEVLIALVRHIQQSTRNMDVVGRLGGEEFGLVLPNTDSSLGFEIAERLRREVEAMEIYHEDQPLKITISLGMTTLSFTQLATPLEDVLARVDGYLYEAKSLGRNCIVRN
ncbi:sensor domain-containing diguanylate cyclase [Vibrio brasiliensis]|uniref:diguanylate cyclase n=1 Tax=Vibrio brasiliensis LMG 20546 TaxID=945543 RepID=E8LQE6_9VIBR|nr:sensor domain-containing diguanylate cyclase [Vibrio brasiliensis]EGA67104.1 GGDEF domain-containing protein [Vibrio brasiliensis LMG 20546]MCG9651274.1 sensor domain-containing diguanylate cyclase [Vibrio brasiliensis]